MVNSNLRKFGLFFGVSNGVTLGAYRDLRDHRWGSIIIIYKAGTLIHLSMPRIGHRQVPSKYLSEEMNKAKP